MIDAGWRRFEIVSQLGLRPIFDWRVQNNGKKNAPSQRDRGIILQLRWTGFREQMISPR
jgi:hypothetical protein